jgi:hypothetical protein
MQGRRPHEGVMKLVLVVIQRPTHYERVTMRCCRSRDAIEVAVRREQLLAIVGCSGSFGGTTGHGATGGPVAGPRCMLNHDALPFIPDISRAIPLVLG